MPSLRVTETLDDAACVPGSKAVGVGFRCFAGDLVVDPCWPESSGRAVVCMIEPWAEAVYRLTLGEELPAPPVVEASVPWGLELEGGIRCLRILGAHDGIGGEPVDYECVDSDLVVYREIDRSGRMWEAHVAGPGSDGYERRPDPVAIVTAWMGEA